MSSNKEAECKYVVATRCFTYNHAPFIEDTLRGFALQETTFPVVFIIVDDASKDGEPNVIKEWAKEYLDGFDGPGIWEERPYGQLAVAKLKNNQLSTFVFLLLSDNHYSPQKRLLKFNYIADWFNNSKYQAICEGDDYWIVPNKLQEQVNFLDAHPDYVLCYTDFKLSSGASRNHSVVTYKDDSYFPGIICGKGSSIGTLTIMYRSDAYAEIPKLWITHAWPMGDQPLYIELSRIGKFKYIPKETASYRILTHSASHGSFDKELSFIDAGIDIRNFYANYYGLKHSEDRFTRSYFRKVMKCAFKHNNRTAANSFMKKAVRYNRSSWKMWFFYFATVLSPFGLLINKIRKDG